MVSTIYFLHALLSRYPLNMFPEKMTKTLSLPELTPLQPLVVAVTAVILLVTFLLSYATYQLFLGTLSPIPGPFWAKITPFWLTLQCRRTARSRVVIAMHEKYGDIIRIAPNHISISRPTALAEIYGYKSGFTKGPFYDSFMQVRPVVFTARDTAVHQRKRKYLNPAFSNRGMADFEPYMDEEIRIWITQLNKMCDSKQVVDFCIWSSSLHPFPLHILH
jgi:benzoate 4-monooxygenase